MSESNKKFHAPSMVLGLACGIVLFAGGWLLGSQTATKGRLDIKRSSASSILKGNTISKIAESASKFVVHIKAMNLPSKDSQFLDFSKPPGFRQNDYALEKESGSGIIVRADGYIVTNNHVIGSANQITVTYNGEKDYPGKVVGRDFFTDLAVIKIEAKDLPVAKIGNCENLKPGDWAIAIGSPMGLDHTVTLGIISALNRSLDELNNVNLIQTDAAINPGNSGGPLLDINGKVIGLNIAMRKNAQSIGFAIPSDLVKEVAFQLIEKGKIERPFVGILMQELTDNLRDSLKIEKDVPGVVITGVKNGSPAQVAQLHQGDILQRVNGKEIKNTLEVQRIVRKHKPGDTVTFLVLRKNKLIPVEVKVGEFPEGSNR